MNRAAAGDDLRAAGRVLASRGLVDAFGHVSVRGASGEAWITPPRPLGSLTPAEALLRLPLGSVDALPAGLPGEGWIHWAIYRRQPTVVAVCRAQPPSALAVTAVADALPALHGQAALVGAPIPVYRDARLVRDRARGEAVAAVLAGGAAVLLRGNGAVTVGATVGEAVARMVLLERAAQVFLAASAAGSTRRLSDDEVEAWQAAAPELLERLWQHLRLTSA